MIDETGDAWRTVAVRHHIPVLKTNRSVPATRLGSQTSPEPPESELYTDILVEG